MAISPADASARTTHAQEVLDGQGFVLIRGAGGRASDRRKRYVTPRHRRLAFGAPRSQNAKGVLGHVRDLGLSAENDPTVQIYQTTERQTFHTDSCDIVALLCLKTAKSGGLSSIASSHVDLQPDGAASPGSGRAPCSGRSRPIAGARSPKQKPFFDIPSSTTTRAICRSSTPARYIQSGQRFADARRLSDLDLEALDYFDNLANDSELRLDMGIPAGRYPAPPQSYRCLRPHRLLSGGTSRGGSGTSCDLWISPPDARALLTSTRNVYGQHHASAAAESSARIPVRMRRFGRHKVVTRSGVAAVPSRPLRVLPCNCLPRMHQCAEEDAQ